MIVLTRRKVEKALARAQATKLQPGQLQLLKTNMHLSTIQRATLVIAGAKKEPSSIEEAIELIKQTEGFEVKE